jgi:hypothetical protein
METSCGMRNPTASASQPGSREVIREGQGGETADGVARGDLTGLLGVSQSSETNINAFSRMCSYPCYYFVLLFVNICTFSKVISQMNFGNDKESGHCFSL